MWKKYKTFFMIGGVILIAAAVGLVLFLQPAEVEAVKVQRTTMTDSFSDVGIVKRGKSVTILSDVKGDVVQVLKGSNAEVKEGDVLARINPLAYEEELAIHEAAAEGLRAQIETLNLNEKSRKNQLNSEIRNMQDQVQQLTSELTVSMIDHTMNVSTNAYIHMLKTKADGYQAILNYQSQTYTNMLNQWNADHDSVNEVEMKALEDQMMETGANLSNAKTEHDDAVRKLNELSQLGITPENVAEQYYNSMTATVNSQIDALNSQITYMQGELKADYGTSAVAAVQAQLDAEEINVEQLRNRIGKCEVKAPSDGAVLTAPITAMVTVSEGDELYTFASANGSVSVECNVLTSYAPYIQAGDEVTITQKLKGENRTFSGTVSEVYDYAYQTTSSLGLAEYRNRIIVSPAEDFDLPEGYDVQTAFFLYRQEDALVIPVSALYTREGQYYVYRIRGGKTAETPVSVIYRSNTTAQIGEGLSEGDEIVKNASAEGMEDGLRVKKCG